MCDSGQVETDEILIRQTVDKSRPGAFDLLTERYYARIYSVVARMTGDQERAMDLVQETFIKAWRGLPHFQNQCGFYTWLYRIARNVIASDVRRHRARPRVVASINCEREKESHSTNVEPSDLKGDPSLVHTKRERREEVLEAIFRLAPEFREVIVLRDMEDHSYEEIAQMLSLPVGTVRSRLHRARLELRDMLRDERGD